MDQIPLPPNAPALLAALLATRRPEASICPSELARVLAEQAGEPQAWRRWMPAAREAAVTLARLGRVRITQGAIERSPDEPMRGAIRIRRGPGFESL
ncbi:hypothetical protein IP84_14460 [beta proteobacterium AAP99]|nr:hypothetical protein IP84_14460 [beta proteobacterium AAP99]